MRLSSSATPMRWSRSVRVSRVLGGMWLMRGGVRESRGNRLSRDDACYGIVMVVLSPVLVRANVPFALNVPEYALQQLGAAGIEAMKGPAVWFCVFVATAVRSPRAAGRAPMCAW